MTRVLRVLLALLVACAIATLSHDAAAARQRVRVSTEVRPDTVLIGYNVLLRFRVWLPSGSSVSFPAQPADDSTTHWRSWVTSTGKSENGLREHRLETRLQSFALGDVRVPGPEVRFTIPGEDAREGRFPTTGFVVASTVPRTGPEPSLRGMKALVPPPWWALVPWFWIAIALAVLAAAGWLWWWLRRRARRPALAPAPETDEPAEVVARRRLAALVAQRLPEQGRTLEHGTELADLLRRFVERRFDSPRPGDTTRELTAHLAVQRDVQPADVGFLRDILEACDLTKFARRPYDAPRAHQAESIAGQLIDRWAPRTADAATAAPAAAERRAS